MEKVIDVVQTHVLTVVLQRYALERDALQRNVADGLSQTDASKIDCCSQSQIDGCLEDRLSQIFASKIDCCRQMRRREIVTDRWV